MTDLIDDYTDADFIDELLRDELRCDCGAELYYCDDDTLSRCNFCDPDRETNSNGLSPTARL